MLPKHLIILTVAIDDIPIVDDANRYKVTIFENDTKKDVSTLSVTASFGFMESPDLEDVITWIANNQELTPDDDMKDWIIYVSKERLIANRNAAKHHKIRFSLFKLLARNSEPTFSAYGLGEDSRISMELVPVKFQDS